MADFDRIVSPLVRSWMDALTFDDFEGADTSAARESFWREMRTTLLQYTTLTIKTILFEHTDFVIILLNHLSPDIFEENRLVWSYACECSRKFVTECGSLVWSVTSHVFLRSDILDSLFDVLAAMQNTLAVNFDDFIRANWLLVEIMTDYEDWSNDHHKKLQSNIAKALSATHPAEVTEMGKSLNKLVENICLVMSMKLNEFLFTTPTPFSENRYLGISSAVLFFCHLLDLPDICTRRPVAVQLILRHISDIAVCPASAIEESCGKLASSLINNIFQTCAQRMLELSQEATARPASDLSLVRILSISGLFLQSGHFPCRVSALRWLEIVCPSPTSNAVATITLPSSLPSSLSNSKDFLPRLQKYLKSCSYKVLYYVMLSVMNAHCYIVKIIDMGLRSSCDIFVRIDEVLPLCIVAAENLIVSPCEEEVNKTTLRELVDDVLESQKKAKAFWKRKGVRERNALTSSPARSTAESSASSHPPVSSGRKEDLEKMEVIEVIDLCSESPPDNMDMAWCMPNVPKATSPASSSSGAAVARISVYENPSDMLNIISNAKSSSSSSTYANSHSQALPQPPSQSTNGDDTRPRQADTSTVPKNPFSIASKKWKQETRVNAVAVIPPAPNYQQNKRNSDTDKNWIGTFVVPTGMPKYQERTVPEKQTRHIGFDDSVVTSNGDEESFAHVDDWRVDATLKSTSDKISKKPRVSGKATSTSTTSSSTSDGTKVKSDKFTSAIGSSSSRVHSTHANASSKSHKAILDGIGQSSSSGAPSDICGADAFYSLDVHGDYNTGIDLDKGYENLLPPVLKAEDMLKPTKRIDFNALLRGNLSTTTAVTSVSAPNAVGKITVPSDDANGRHRIHQVMSTPTIQKDMESVSIDAFFLKLLTLPLASYLPPKPPDSNAAGKHSASSGADATRKEQTKDEVVEPASLTRRPSASLSKIPNRFMDESTYIRTFQPLLEAELEASLIDFVQFEGQGTSSKREKKDGGRIWGGAEGHIGSSGTTAALLPKVYVRCAILNEPSDNGLVEARVGTLQGDHRGQYGGVSLLKDDLIVIVHQEIAGDFRSLREVLSVNHCLAIVVSQAANPKVKADTSTNGAEQYNQQRLIMVKGTELPMEVDWVCFPLLGLSTHIREWSALNSMASHTLMPLAPYILKGAPVASSQYLKSLLDSIDRALNNVVVKPDEVVSPDAIAAATRLIDELEKTSIDMTTLRKADAINRLKGFEARGGLAGDIKTRFSQLRKLWKSSVKSDQQAALIGGNVLYGRGDISCPQNCTSKQWEVLSRTHNNTQLFAIRYVMDRY